MIIPEDVTYALALGVVVGFFDWIRLMGATLGAITLPLATAPVSFPDCDDRRIVLIIVWHRFEDYVVLPSPTDAR
jgi:hypothetical protein